VNEHVSFNAYQEETKTRQHVVGLLQVLLTQTEAPIQKSVTFAGNAVVSNASFALVATLTRFPPCSAHIACPAAQDVRMGLKSKTEDVLLAAAVDDVELFGITTVVGAPVK
jgi:hypothetical protein